MPHASRRISANQPAIDAKQARDFEQLADPVWIYDFQSATIRWANEAGLNFWSAASLDELQQRDIGPTSEGVRARIRNLEIELNQGREVIEQWTLFPAGKPALMLCKCRGIKMLDGRIGMLVEAEPPTHDPVLATELRAVEALRHTPLMISMFTSEGRALMRNPAATSLVHRLHIAEEGPIDAYLAMFANDDEAEKLRRSAYRRGKAEATLRLAGRQALFHHVSLRTVQDPLSGAPALLVAQQDVTKAQQLERQLQKALKRERETTETQRHFLALASHEFKTPLSIIDGAAQRILRSAAEADTQLIDRVRRIRAAVTRMSHAVYNTLAATRIDERQVAFEPEPADLNDIIGRACETQLALHRNRRLELRLHDLPPLRLDPRLTEQVFENILSNAIKYSPPTSPVEIEATVSKSYVTVRVIDHGIGIPASDMHKLGTRFFRGTNAQDMAGTGIGLNTVRYFMQLQGGHVRIRSHEGQGTTVELRFHR